MSLLDSGESLNLGEGAGETGLGEVLHTNETVVSEATQLSEDVRVVYLPRSRLETPGHVAYFNILDQPVLHPLSQIPSQVALRLLQVEYIEIQLNVRVIHIA